MASGGDSHPRTVAVVGPTGSLPLPAHTIETGVERMLVSITRPAWTGQHRILRERWTFQVEQRDGRIARWSTRADALDACDRLVVDTDPAWVDDGRCWFESVPEADGLGRTANGGTVGIYLTGRPGHHDRRCSLTVELRRDHRHERYSTIGHSCPGLRSHRAYIGDMIEMAVRGSWSSPATCLAS